MQNPGNVSLSCQVPELFFQSKFSSQILISFYFLVSFEVPPKPRRVVLVAAKVKNITQGPGKFLPCQKSVELTDSNTKLNSASRPLQALKPE